MKVAWNLKGGGISGFTMDHDELPVLHDVFSSAIASGCLKTSYIVQLLWRDLTSGFHLIGPYFPVPNSMDSMSYKNFSCCAWKHSVHMILELPSFFAIVHLLIWLYWRSCVDFPGQHSPLMRRQQMRELGTLWTCRLLTRRILREIQYLQWFSQVIR